jgi:antitoxin-like ribbon-helix-helix protein
MKKSALAVGLKAAAGHSAAKPREISSERRKEQRTVLIGAHFAPEVRRTLLLVQAEERNTGKTLKQILGEAINDLCVKYGKPQPYGGEE